MENNKKNYIVTVDFKSPYVVQTGIPKQPTRVEFKPFRRGTIISGVLIKSSGQPAYVLHNGIFVLPLSNIKEMVTKDVSFSMEGDKKPQASILPPAPKNPKLKYLDAIIIGSLIGAGVVFLAQKKNWIAEQDHMYKLYGAAGFAALGAYWVYRKNNKNVKIQPK